MKKKTSESKPKISIIVPVYNVQGYLPKCLNSLISQTLKDIEIICIDDGSTDDSLAILQNFAAKDKRIKILQQSNLGAYPARNNGLNHAKGEYIGFMDSDDNVDENYYELLYTQAEESRAEIVITDNVQVYKNGKISKKNLGISPAQYTVNSIEEKGKIIVASGIMWNKIYRRDFIEKHHIRCLDLQGGGGDNYWCALCLFYAQNIVINHEARYNYILNDASITQSVKTRKNFVLFDVYQALDEKLKKETTIKEWKLWSQYINKRKLFDFRNYYNNMEAECKEEFKQIALSSLKTAPLIISLTSYPARIKTLNQTVYSLLTQSIKADKVILWLAKEQFPNKEKDLPSALTDLTTIGLEIKWYHDIKSFKKLIPTIKKYPNTIIITADDDVIYAHNWLEKLFLSYINNPDSIHCHRAHCITFKNKLLEPYSNWIWHLKYNQALYNNLFTGVGGVLYPPHCLHKDVLDEEKFMRLCPQADDIWFWAMAVKNDFPIKVVENNISKLNFIDGTQENALWHTNVTGGQNDIQLQNVLKEYPEILDKLDKTITMAPKIKKVAPKAPPKSIISYNLFHFIPFYTYKRRGGNQVWKILGIPIWRIRKMENTHTVKCYLFGLPFIKICGENVEHESEYVSLD